MLHVTRPSGTRLLSQREMLDVFGAVINYDGSATPTRDNDSMSITSIPYAPSNHHKVHHTSIITIILGLLSLIYSLASFFCLLNFQKRCCLLCLFWCQLRCFNLKIIHHSSLFVLLILAIAATIMNFLIGNIIALLMIMNSPLFYT